MAKVEQSKQSTKLFARGSEERVPRLCCIVPIALSQTFGSPTRQGSSERRTHSAWLLAVGDQLSEAVRQREGGDVSRLKV